MPFWKCSHVCYEELVLFCRLSIEDYPWCIGPYPSPMTWVSYMESTFQFSLINHHHDVICHNQPQSITITTYVSVSI